MFEEKNKLFNTQEVNHNDVIQKLVKESSPRKTFLAMIFLSSVIAALGLLNDSVTVVIGAMLVAPLLWPVIGISMGLIVRDWKMIQLSSISVFFSVVIAVATSMVITFFYVPLGASREILLTTNPTFMFPVAIAAGAAAAFALVYPSIREAVTGVAISVALLPPLVSVGIGLGGTDWELMRRSAELFSINLLGIILTALLVFAALGFYRYQRTVEAAVKKEEKVLKNQ
jgi:uncharacterized hydrophobic protein (TIGR00271 family)